MKLVSIFFLSLAILAAGAPVEQEGADGAVIGQLVNGFVSGLNSPGVETSTCQKTIISLRDAFYVMIGSFETILENAQNIFLVVNAFRIWTNDLNSMIASCKTIDFTALVHGAFDEEQFAIYIVKFFSNYPTYNKLLEQITENFNDENYFDAGADAGKIFAGVTCLLYTSDAADE